MSLSETRVVSETRVGEIGHVRITEAYITAQRDFLKAWASFVHEARTYGSQQETKFLLPENLWMRVAPLKEEDQKEGSQVSRSKVVPTSVPTAITTVALNPTKAGMAVVVVVVALLVARENGAVLESPEDAEARARASLRRNVLTV